MKSRAIRLLSLALMLILALQCLALAEDGEPSAAPIDETVQEIELDLALAGEDAVPEAFDVSAGEEEPAVDEPGAKPTPELEVPIGETGEGGPGEVGEGEPVEPEATVSPEPTPEPTATPEPGPTYFSGELRTRVFKLSKNLTKTVYIGVPYQVKLKKGEIKSIKSSAKKVATGSKKTGMLSLKKPGTAKLTVKAKNGKKYVLTLKVKEAPAPSSPKIKATSKKFTLSWKAARYATYYLVESSPNGEDWSEFKSTTKLKMTVTKAVTGTTWFRVTACLGDHFGGSSEAVCVLSPVTDVKVFMEESFKYGPTERMNVTWTASPFATKYEVYRASLPSDDYKLVGTTKKTWFADTLSPKKLYAYRIKPVWGKLDDLPMTDPVTLWSDMPDNVLPPKDLASETGIILVVNKQAQVVTAYIRDSKGRYRLPLRHMICSTGQVYEQTRNGTFSILYKKNEWYTYPGPSGTTIRWPSVYRGSYYFHSPLYSRSHSISTSAINRLGRRASAGCIRLKSNDAEWVYRHCDVGTPVYICDGMPIEDLVAALKPADVDVQGF